MRQNSKKLESKFQSELIRDLKAIFPGCVVQKQDASSMQGIPDLLILYNDRWAMLECKRDELAHHQPNQDYYVNKFDRMSFCRFIYPENKEEVLNALQQSLCSNR